MGSPKGPLTTYRMRALKGGKDGSITYAVTCPGGRSVNGKRSSNIMFWGHLTDRLVFEPMLRFQLLPDKEKRKYIFPPEWDISRAFETVYTRKEKSVIHNGPDMIRIYGDEYLLECISGRIGLRDDLKAVFGGDDAARIFSLACYLILTDKTVAHYERVENARRFPSTEEMDERASITLLTQRISQEGIGRFMRLRSRRCGQDTQWFGIDSTSITSYAKGIGDVTWGLNKEGDKTRQLNMNGRLRLHIRPAGALQKLAGGLPDSRSLRLLREEMISAGTPPVGYVSDRAYLTEENLDYVIEMGLKCTFMARYDRTCHKGGHRGCRRQRQDCQGWRVHQGCRLLRTRVRLPPTCTRRRVPVLSMENPCHSVLSSSSVQTGMVPTSSDSNLPTALKTSQKDCFPHLTRLIIHLVTYGLTFYWIAIQIR